MTQHAPASTNQQTPPPAPSATPPAQAPGTDIGSLTSQVSDLNVQLAGLRAQWDGLRHQLDNMLQSNPARPGVQQQWANVGVQIAEVEGKVATLNARIAQRQGRPVGITNMPVIAPIKFDPDLVIAGGTAVTLMVALPISIALARRILRRSPAPAPVAVPADVTSRLERIEQAIDTVAIEVERISENQRFVTRIMAERPANAPASSAAPAESRQPLALGAGPIEQVVVSERDFSIAKNR
jgi:tetrahydromethanopterin S-methyltransferase subunit G